MVDEVTVKAKALGILVSQYLLGGEDVPESGQLDRIEGKLDLLMPLVEDNENKERPEYKCPDCGLVIEGDLVYSHDFKRCRRPGYEMKPGSHIQRGVYDCEDDSKEIAEGRKPFWMRSEPKVAK